MDYLFTQPERSADPFNERKITFSPASEKLRIFSVHESFPVVRDIERCEHVFLKKY